MTRIILMIVAVSTVLCCTSGQDESTTHYGHRVVYHKHGDGPKADSGYIAKFTFDMMLDDNDTLDLAPGRDPKFIETANIISPKQNQFKNAILDALYLMNVGDSVTVYQPTDSLQGLPPQFKGYENIKYTVCLKDLVTVEEHNAEQARLREEQQKKMIENQARESEIASLVSDQLSAYKAGTIKDLIELESGLKIQFIEKGSGDKISKGDPIEANYYGVLQSDGSMFDNSFQRGSPISFRAGSDMIDGWNVGLLHMNHGDKVMMYIPYMMAYKEQGRGEAIPAKSDLAFYIEAN